MKKGHLGDRDSHGVTMGIRQNSTLPMSRAVSLLGNRRSGHRTALLVLQADPASAASRIPLEDRHGSSGG